jgi:hypothetical protein
VAGRVAYHQLIDKENRISVSDDLGRALPLVACALSAVAPIHRGGASAEAHVLSAQEVEALLFRPGFDAAAVLDELYIRRSDLHQAIESLRTAKQYFGAKP